MYFIIICSLSHVEHHFVLDPIYRHTCNKEKIYYIYIVYKVQFTYVFIYYIICSDYACMYRVYNNTYNKIFRNLKYTKIITTFSNLNINMFYVSYFLEHPVCMYSFIDTYKCYASLYVCINAYKVYTCINILFILKYILCAHVCMYYVWDMHCVTIHSVCMYVCSFALERYRPQLAFVFSVFPRNSQTKRVFFNQPHTHTYTYIHTYVYIPIHSYK